MSRFRARRRSFRGRRSNWKQNTWGYTPIGDLDAQDNFSCRERLMPFEQSFWPVLVDDQFNADENNAPFQQERIVCMRCIADIDFLGDVGPPDQALVLPPVRWALARLDEEAVQDVTYLFPSLFGIDFHLNERVLLTGNLERTPPEAAAFVPLRTTGRIKFDQTLNTRVETGDTIWLVIETGACDEDAPSPSLLRNWFAVGFTRALWRT